MIVIIDYGMGNLGSVQNALHHLGYQSICSADRKTIMQAEKVILPGVGAFGDAMRSLEKNGLDQTVKEIIKAGIPFLGICLGLQLLFSVSEENGCHQGLDLVPGRVVRFDLPAKYKVPHIGWNQININPDSRLLQGIQNHTHFYFVHSYCGQPQDPGWVVAECDYGRPFCGALEKDNAFATQFHPEKSGYWGLKVLKNFGEMK